MLRKLMKAEFQATARYFLPAYLLLIVLAVMSRVTLSVTLQSNEFLQNMFVNIPTFVIVTFYILSLIGVCVITFLVAVLRFYRNLMGDEGYLMFTLPVTTAQHIWNKLIVSLVWSVCSVLVCILTFFILMADQNLFSDLADFFAAVGALYRQGGFHAWLITLLLLLFLLSCAVHGYLQIYGAIATGSQVKNHRVLAGIGFYLLFSFAEQILTGFLISGGVFFLESFFRSLTWNGELLWTYEAAVGMVELVLAGLTAFELVLSAGYYIATHQILKYKLNLE